MAIESSAAEKTDVSSTWRSFPAAVSSVTTPPALGR
jgi:hypothetical protein